MRSCSPPSGLGREISGQACHGDGPVLRGPEVASTSGGSLGKERISNHLKQVPSVFTRSPEAMR